MSDNDNENPDPVVHRRYTEADGKPALCFQRWSGKETVVLMEDSEHPLFVALDKELDEMEEEDRADAESALNLIGTYYKAC